MQIFFACVLPIQNLLLFLVSNRCLLVVRCYPASFSSKWILQEIPLLIWLTFDQNVKMRAADIGSGLVSVCILLILLPASRALPSSLKPRPGDAALSGYSIYEGIPISRGYTYGGNGPAPTLFQSLGPTRLAATSEKSGRETSISTLVHTGEVDL